MYSCILLKVNQTLLRVFFLLIVTVSATVHGQEKITDISLLNVVDGKNSALSSLCKGQYAVVVFSSNKCVYDKYYKDRLAELINTYQPKGISFVAINSSVGVNESVANMKSRTLFFKTGTPYLADEKQEAKNQFGATKTPEAFLIKKQAGAFVILYKGAIDNNPQLATDVKDSYLKTILDEILAGDPLSWTDTNAVGCMIRPLP